MTPHLFYARRISTREYRSPELYLKRLHSGSFEDETAQFFASVKLIGDALQSSMDGFIEFAHRMGRVPVWFSPDQEKAIRAMVEKGDSASAQKYILDAFRDNE